MSKTIRSKGRRQGLGALTLVALCASMAAVAQGNRPPGAGGGGEEGAGNNLSFPAIESDQRVGSSASFTVTDALLGVTYSYGCNKPEVVDSRSFPNTSCVSADGRTYYTAAQCVTVGAPCAGEPVASLDRIYWQKRVANTWNPDTAPGTGMAVDATYLDWGDNLESRTWTTRSVIRVEMTPFAAVAALRGLQMWHVVGQGTNELWGARATEGGLPYVFTATDAIVNTTKARLNIAKIANGPQTCPTVPTGPSVPTGSWTGSGWAGMWVLLDTPFVSELNIGGKYVYGYNWNLRKDVVPTTVDKAGWWRLTFYAPTAVNFLATTKTIVYTPDAGVPTPLPTGFVSLAEEADTGPLYLPVSDPRYNLTYIDICVAGTQGGGKGGTK